MSENGSYVTRAELAAHIKGVDEHFDNLEADMSEIKYNLIGIVNELRKQRDQQADDLAAAVQDRKAAWRSWGPALASAVIAAMVSGIFTVVGYFVFA